MQKRKIFIRKHPRRIITKRGRKIIKVKRHKRMIPITINQHQIDVFRHLSMRPRETGGYLDFNKKGQLERTILRFGDKKKVWIPPEDYEAEWHTHPNPRNIKADRIFKINSHKRETAQKIVDEQVRGIKVPFTLKVRKVMRSYLPSEDDMFRFLNQKKRRAMVIFHQNDAILFKKTDDTDRLIEDMKKKYDIKTADDFINHLDKMLVPFYTVLPLNRLVTNKPVNRDYIIQLYKNDVNPTLKKELAVEVMFIPKEKKELITKLEVVEPK